MKTCHSDYYIKCDKCKQEYTQISVRRCPHSAVNRRFGEHICVCCCQKCKFSERVSGGLACDYKGEVKDVKDVKDVNHY